MLQPKTKILNSRGDVGIYGIRSGNEPVVLNAREWKNCEHNQRVANSLGYEVAITTLTGLNKDISEQKFYEAAPADYVDVKVGENAWTSNITTFRSFNVADAFETGIINLGGQNSRLASADAAVDALNILVNNWAKEITWTIPELEMASRSGNWDLVTAKQQARKENFDLGIQRVTFLGANGLNGAGGTCLGLLNQPGVTTNTTLITGPISLLSPANLATLCAKLVETFRANCNRTAWPDRFVVPESDYNGMAAQSSPTYPIKSILQVLEESLQITTRNKGFKIMPLAYGDHAYNNLGTGDTQAYALYRSDKRSMVANVPVPYTSTMANSINNFQYQDAAYAQFTGLQLLRPLELMYFQYQA